jgi:hypothetical protein
MPGDRRRRNADGQHFGGDGNRFGPDGKCLGKEGKRLALMGSVLAVMENVWPPREVFRLSKGGVLASYAFLCEMRRVTRFAQLGKLC